MSSGHRKRELLKDYIRKYDVDICCVQETLISEPPLASWWPGHSFWSLVVGKQGAAAIILSQWHKDIFFLNVFFRRFISGDSTVAIEISRLKSELKALISRELEGSKIRSRVQWFEEGERPTRYFFKLQHERMAEVLLPRFWMLMMLILHPKRLSWPANADVFPGLTGSTENFRRSQ